MPGGLVYGCKPVGYQSAYKGEMVALYLAAYYAEAGTTIHVDCKGVITSVLKGGCRVVKLREIEAETRQGARRNSGERGGR